MRLSFFFHGLWSLKVFLPGLVGFEWIDRMTATGPVVFGRIKAKLMDAKLII